jgi:acetyltransferase-like isoleucine patch superfamily enzyme
MPGIREWGCGKYHKPQIGENVTMSGDGEIFMDTQAQITIGKDTFMGHGVKILTGSHNYYLFGEARQRALIPKPVTIGEGVWIASFAIILPGVTLGDHSVVGAGSVVTHDVAPYTLVAGNPSRVIKTIPH